MYSVRDNKSDNLIGWDLTIEQATAIVADFGGTILMQTGTAEEIQSANDEYRERIAQTDATAGWLAADKAKADARFTLPTWPHRY